MKTKYLLVMVRNIQLKYSTFKYVSLLKKAQISISDN